jgi:hypothetical protein
MLKLLRKIFIPHDSNDFHPYSTRHHTFFTYAIILLILNYLIFPILGLDKTRVLASDLDANKIIALENKERQSAGLQALSLNPRLSKAAQEKAKNMFDKQYWAHFGPDGETPWKFITESDYQFVYAGENLAKDFKSNTDVHLAWMNSPTHKQNIMSQNFHDIGIAIVNGKFNGSDSNLIVVMFGSTQGEVNAVANINDQVSSNLTPPTINEPFSGTTFESKEITFRGSTQSGDLLKVYSNNELIGEVQKTGATFSLNATLNDYQNEVYVKAYDSKTSQYSMASNIVDITISEAKQTLAAASISTPLDSQTKFLDLNIKPLSTAKLINVIFGLALTAIILVDLFFMVRNNRRRMHTSFHSFNFVLLIITFIGMVGL